VTSPLNQRLTQGRHFRTLAPKPFHAQVPHLDIPAGKSGLKVAIFTGCLIDKLFPNIAYAALKVLDHCGVGVFLPDNQGCCGIPALSSGDLPTFHKLLAHSIERFEAGEFDFLITACATCASTIHEIWPVMSGDNTRNSATRLAKRTMDINQFLIQKAKLKPRPYSKDPSHIVTYHDPCHLKKSLNVINEPRTVIRASAGYQLKEMAEPDWCCGMGGSFNLQHYDISKRIGMKKAAQIQATGADVLATGCPACMIQICDMLSQSGAEIAVRHPVELFAETLI
jgi:glycolate oxidase iron-sulfur subunit